MLCKDFVTEGLVKTKSRLYLCSVCYINCS